MLETLKLIYKYDIRYLQLMLYKKGYTDVTMVVGSDRVREFENN